jgi:steroid 5-alpha reductase family enzyme
MNGDVTALGFLAIVVAISLALSAIMSFAWLVWRRSRNSGWVDTTWTFGLGAVGLAGALSACLLDMPTARQVLVAVMITLWSSRLGFHIAHRSAGITDDPRYATLIRDWGSGAMRRMLFLLQKQALVTIPLALSMVLAAFNPISELRPQDWLGVGILLLGIGGEALSDYQLRQFRADPAHHGRICDTGLWGWSRHPNYFFEWFGWLAYPLFAIDLGGGNPWGYAAIAGPICMYWLLVHVSGIPPLEAHMQERCGDEFHAYQARTNAFFPAPPRTTPVGP